MNWLTWMRSRNFSEQLSRDPGIMAPSSHETLPTERPEVTAEEKMAASSSSSSSRNSRDKIKCLDGLRGIACLIVFNYHFLWPWTPMIMMGHGALPPLSPEPYFSLPSLPILCLLHRGRPMVAIFFAISGYVLCRHILRAIRERRLEAAYQSLASSVFRRVFRLYLPPTISMFLVAILAQIGAFKSEEAIFTGPDSVYINGTKTFAQFNETCVNGTQIVGGALGVAEYLHMETSTYLNTTGWNDTLCLNATSKLASPAGIYKIVDWVDALSVNPNATNQTRKWEDHTYYGPGSLFIGDGTNRTSTNFTLIQLGGSWEEHPFIHDNITYALQNFTRTYAEWANPFNFGHYHPRYDPHTFTIPMELRGSMFIYIFLLGTAALQPKWRRRFGGFLAAYSLLMGRWDMATFMGGMLLSELDVWRSHDDDKTLAPPVVGTLRARRQQPKPGSAALRWAVFVVALYFLSYPDAGAEYTPGFEILSWFVPKYYIPLSGWMFYQAMGALLLLPCVLRSQALCRILEGRIAQYLGKISFSLYLVHGPVLHCLGFWIMPRLFDHFGRTLGFAIGWPVLLIPTLYLADWWYRKVDVWSTGVGKRIEKIVLA